MKPKRFAASIFTTIVFILVISTAFAATVGIEIPASLVENQDTLVSVIVNSTTQFNGNVQLAFTNIQSQTTSFTFAEADIASGSYSFGFSLKGIAQGPYQVLTTLLDQSGVIATASKAGAVNSSIPFVVSSSPSGIISKDIAIISVRTNEIASCRIDTSNSTYSNMSSFSNTNSNMHNITFTGLSQGERTYYVKCQDSAGYTMIDPYQVKFTVDLPPSAQVELSDDSPVKAGMIEVELVLSESLDNAPSLEYQYNDNNPKKPISLTGSGSKWKGFLIITESDDNKIGTFYFSAIDSSGNIGNKITNGNVFVVDTKKPSPPISLKAIAEPGGKVKLNWYYDGEEADYYKVYRSTTSGVNYVDYYADSNGSKQFIDKSTIDRVSYFYKISTVDNAGNEGSLSDEVYATAEKEGQIQASSTSSKEDIKRVLPPNLLPFVDDEIKKIESIIMDVRQTEEVVKAFTGDEKEILKEFGAESAISSSKSGLESLISRLQDMKEVYATEKELLERIEEINMEIKKIEKTTPKSAKLLEKSNFAQTISKEDITNAVEKIFTSSISPEDKNEYVKRNEKEKDNIKIDTFVKVYEITFLDGSILEKSWISKKIKYEGAKMPSDVLVIETIPKSIAEHASELNFGSQLAEVLENDPIIKFGYHEFKQEGETLYYTLDKKINADEVKNTKTVFILNPNSFAVQNGVTGNSIFSSFDGFDFGNINSILMWIGATLVLGIFGYYYVFVKDYGINMKRPQDVGDDTTRQLDYSNQNEGELLDELSSHMKEVKAELADKLLPLFVALNQKMESKKTKNSATDYQILLINALIDQAHGYIDNNLHHEAVKIYPRISDLYQRLSKDQRNDIFARCSHLHRRMHFKRPF